MLINIEELKGYYTKFNEFDDRLLERKLKAIELAIRKYTNNNFQNRAYREACKSVQNKLISATGAHYFKVGDTVQISVDKHNKGLYTVIATGGDFIEVDNDLIASNDNLVTRVDYPIDIVEGAIKILEWDLYDRDKVGISSETISRHSVSYQTYDANNTIDGYPAMLFGFCRDYMRARV